MQKKRKFGKFKICIMQYNVLLFVGTEKRTVLFNVLLDTFSLTVCYIKLPKNVLNPDTTRLNSFLRTRLKWAERSFKVLYCFSIRFINNYHNNIYLDPVWASHCLFSGELSKYFCNFQLVLWYSEYSLSNIFSNAYILFCFYSFWHFFFVKSILYKIWAFLCG